MRWYEFHLKNFKLNIFGYVYSITIDLFKEIVMVSC